jgi:DNA invertase Pin-like site-specific DNA recombinase
MRWWVKGIDRLPLVEREGFSMPAQLSLLRSYTLPNGLSIAQEFEDVETAKQAGRSGFGQMISFLKKNSACRVLVVEKTDRLYRNFSQCRA